MSGAQGALVAAVSGGEIPSGPLSGFVLVRAGAENGATRADLVRDLAPMVSHRLSPSELRTGIDGTVEGLALAGLIEVQRSRCRLTGAGAAKLSAWLGPRSPGLAWAQLRDVVLVAAALGGPITPTRLKLLVRPDGLRAAILQKAYGIAGKRSVSTARLRVELAVVALERAFGNKIKSGLDAGRGLSVKASRLLAGQLAARPRDFGTDSRLVATLAAEAVGAAQSDAASLRAAVLRRYFNELLPVAPGPTSAPSREMPVSKPEVQTPRQHPAAANRPDLAGFASEVLAQAETCADGWPGNRKSLIADVWRKIEAVRPEWGLTDIEFKSMLTEAHRTGHIVLANADIRNKEKLAELHASAIAYKNTVWHFVRVDT